MSTSSSESSILLVEEKPDGTRWGTMDEYLTYLCLEKTIGEVNMMRERSNRVRNWFAARLICIAIFEKDIGAILQIADRIDGAIPDKSERDSFANLVGDAIEDVMDLPAGERIFVNEDDLTIIAMAKVIIWISMETAGGNVMKKKDRQKAIEMILKRTGGKRSEPVREAERLEFVEPDWMKALPS